MYSCITLSSVVPVAFIILYLSVVISEYFVTLTLLKKLIRLIQ